MSRLFLVAVLLFGLVMTTPVLCVCDPDDHGGMALHSLLPHAHGPADAAQHPHGPADAAQHPHDGAEVPADGHADGRQSPAVTAQTGTGAASLATVGAVGLALSPPWQIEPTMLGRLAPPLLLAPRSHARPPLGPPPR